jgi:uncharacterized protein (TIGR02271 family)
MTMGELTNGMKVRSSDGESLGKIVRLEPGSLVVEKGFFFPKDYAVPLSMVREVRDDECWLSISKQELERERDSATLHDTGREAAAEGTVGGISAMPGEGSGRTKDERRLTLSEEELEARRRVREAGEVTVRKEVVTEHRQLDVPVTKEEVHVERGPATSASAPEGEAFREETLRVPVREEEVEVTKRPRVREEVRVSRTAGQQERRVEGDVRREEARIDRTDERGRQGEGEEEPPGGIRGDEP